MSIRGFFLTILWLILKSLSRLESMNEKFHGRVLMNRFVLKIKKGEKKREFHL